METISNIAIAARNSVFGESATTAPTRSSEPPAAGAPSEGIKEAPHQVDNVPEQVPTQPGTEPLSGAPLGKGTPDAPFDRGNEPEQIQATDSSAATKTATEAATDSLPPTTTTRASKIDNPDPSSASDMKSAVAANDATNPVSKMISNTSSDTESKAKKAGTAKAGSHSALFGLGPKEEIGDAAIHAPKGSGEISGTFDEAAEVMAEQAEKERRGATEADTGGYVGLQKAAMEEEEKKRKNGGTAAAAAEGTGWAATTSASASALAPPEDERDPRSIEKKNSLGRDVSPGEMPDGTHRKSIAEGMPAGHHFTKRTTASSGGEKTAGLRERLKEKFRSKK